ncbi:hypothetical protein Ae201684P_013835 [Aphanomyces euteiches]|uniref:Expansin-like EG45 domain-containing protein n=1 Tax=Aphanomyces euteiches TaxID=100861 RepID=A0A6G0WBI8_9STRA|nr:hypothetical protein Ae201684_016685 [Aphanomyces euteiches]KAH9082932.1 hypothetical protein Ae201684P_013835 [Aphanomyces euteiches]KAH9147917.1 hypothetical protein AeRB84_008574 [Aphanomyces euteiches]
MMRLVGFAALVALVAVEGADISGKIKLNYARPGDGTCQLQNLDGDKSTKYVTVPGKKFATCGRCVQITCADSACTAGSSVVAYVVGTLEGGQASDPLLLSLEAAKALTSSQINTPISITWKFLTCPSNFVTGNIKACMMDGASANYIPLQFYNSYRPIESAVFGTTPANQSANGFFYSSGKISDSSTYYSNIAVQLTAGGTTVQGSLSFQDPSTNTKTNCADTGVQFSKPSDDEGSQVDPISPGGGGSSGGSKSSVLLPAVLGGVGGLVLIGLLIFCIRRRRANKDFDEDEFERRSIQTRSSKDRSGYKPASQPQIIAANYNEPPAVLGGNTPTLADHSNSTPSTTYSRIDSDVPTPPPPPPPPLVIPERQPAANPKVVVKSLQTIQQNQDRGQSYSEMFSETNRGMYSRGSSILMNTRDDRKSFDIDEERDVDSPSRSTEHDVQLDMLLQSGALSLHNDPFSSDAVTSPESFVRATSMLRSNSLKTNAPIVAAPRTSVSRDSQSNLLQYQHKKRELSQHQF